jgi:hypothetical protein
MKCPNDYCAGVVEEHVNSVGGGSRYCLDGCGYYEELPAGTFMKRQQEKLEFIPPVKKGGGKWGKTK